MRPEFSRRDTIKIAEFISKDLMIRNSADVLFDYIKRIKTNEIIIDFTGIQSISRAFAHQYLLNKRKSFRNIIDINLSPEIKPMFDLVKKTEKGRK